MRQNLGAVLKDLIKTGEPILVQRSSQPAAVLITIEDYQKRFVDRIADEKRKAIVEQIRSARIKLPKGVKSIDLIRMGRE